MRSKHVPAAILRWEDQVRRSGCAVTGQSRVEPAESGDIQIHHVLGEQAVRNKEKVGGWYILPLHWRLHDPSSDLDVNITRNRNAFTDKYGTEKYLFFRLLFAFWVAGMEVPVPVEVLNAIAAHSER